jgi:hypothetical protein
MWDDRPKDWGIRRLSEVTKRIVRKNDGAGHPVMTISARHGFMLQSEKYSRDMAGKSEERYILLKSGEFAYNRGNSLTAPQGCVYRLDVASAVVPFVYYCFSVSNELDQEFAQHAFQGGVLNRELARSINSSVRDDGLLNLPADDFFRCQIAIPPLAEQRAIADVLSAVEAAISKTEALIEATTRSLNTTLDWFLGDDREKIAPTVPLGSVIEGMKYGTSSKCNDDASGVPVLRIPNVLSGGINLNELKYAQIPSSEAAKYSLSDGDLLAVRTNGNPEYVGRMALVRGLKVNAAYASYLIRIRVDRAKVMPEFVWLCSATYPLRDTLTAAARTSAGNFNINSDGIRSALIPLPDIQTQERIVAAAEALRSRRNAECSYLCELRSIHRALAQELLSGRLRLPDSMIARHAGMSEKAA